MIINVNIEGMGGGAPPPPPPPGMGPPPPPFGGFAAPKPPDVLPYGLKPKKIWKVDGIKRANWKTVSICIIKVFISTTPL